MLWAVLRVAIMFRHSRTQAFIRSRITRAAIVTEVWKRAFLLVCETGSYTNVSALSARSHQLYRNTNVFGLKCFLSSAPKVQQLDVNIQRRSRSQAHGRSDIRINKILRNFIIFYGKDQNLLDSLFFSNFLRFRNGNCRFFQKIISQKLENELENVFFS